MIPRMEAIMNESDAKEKIRTAINDSGYLWRTATGIAADTRLPLEKVMEVLEQADGFLEAERKNQRGKTLYTTEQKYWKKTPWTRLLLDAMTNTVGI
jgi:hypothetical protein